jgi:2-keto-3-deoxy-L-rhamnonate aldolase RhmA
MTSPENPVKRTLAAGGVAIGTMVFEFSTTGIARIAAVAGAEFLVFDMEHTGWSIETIRQLIATSIGVGLVPLVRPPGSDYHLLSRVLDVGAMGLMVPMVETEAQARHIVQSAKYAPLGRRGAAFGVAHDGYRGGDIAEKMEASNREQLLIAQIETAQGVENVERIAAVEGIDVLWVGHNDLSISLGIPGQLTNPRYVSAVDRVQAACERHNKTFAFMATSIDDGKALLKRGVRCLAYSGDIWIFQEALRLGIAALRG